jgi:uncharacterized protein (TIGR02300 family)
MANAAVDCRPTAVGGRVVSKPEWGVKRLCQNCGTKFYDLKRTLLSCPSCGAEVERDSPLKNRRTRGAAPKPAPQAAPKKPRAAETDDDGEDAEDLEDTDLGDTDVDDDLGDEADDDLMEDTSELGDDDMSDVISSTEDDNDDDR